MADHAPRYRFRGSVEPSAAVARPVAAYRNAVAASGTGSSPASATLDIFDVIDSYGGWWGISARDVDRALQAVGNVDTLHVRINSPGGEATEGVAIANLLRAHSADVRVTVYGLAASAASVIAIAGDSVSMAPGSVFMVHEASGIEFGTADQMRAEAAALDAISDSYASLYALKAGGDPAEWRAVMRKNGWYTPEAAVEAKLADRVGLDPEMPTDLAPVEEARDDDEPDLDSDFAMSAAARAAARRFDLSLLPNAPAALAAQTPAASADGSTETQERSVAVEFTDEQLNTMRQQLGLPEDADAAAIIAAQAEALAEQADPPAASIDTSAVVTALEADGKVVVSKARFDALEAQAAEGAKARAKQITDERNELIEAAMASGKISRSDETRKVWEGEFARNFDTAKADLESLPARFPVGQMVGTQGHDGSAGADAAFTDEEAGALAQMAGVSKEGLLR